ncbi:hypothetical protein GOOTI_214_00020 [Gordonia otitidis NBRC 100426]|uniref:Uncharacterized protein n=1 Tax=Gordonia otitidis (strain DSM 44809 / CCUG 52243 / JCM 12355 / NBRC 100426 / IFM 10032) TaxID=1108044 RepID=H5TSB8_GORO1|nr:hypothetical protein GOOTI_214_00020 [Gordonia otitidis NBRC 100426]
MDIVTSAAHKQPTPSVPPTVLRRQAEIREQKAADLLWWQQQPERISNYLHQFSQPAH